MGGRPFLSVFWWERMGLVAFAEFFPDGGGWDADLSEDRHVWESVVADGLVDGVATDG
jgi:hypothetical protein